VAGSFARGEKVRIQDGVFRNFVGAVDRVEEERRMLTVSITLLGRALKVELGFGQVQRIA